MSFRLLTRLLIAVMTLGIVACSDSDKETRLVELFETASQDVVAISFLTNAETVVSTNAYVDYSVQGVRSNGVDLVTLSRPIEWSLSPGAISRIDQNGRFTAGDREESLTVTARLGVLTASLEIRVSAARFDRVVQLHDVAFSVEMCQSHTIKPFAIYVDENGNEEPPRPVDSNVINTLEWIIRDAAGGAASSRAYIETSANQATLHTLAAGNLLIQARAQSAFRGVEVTSAEFNQSVGGGLNSIRLCLGSAQDLSNCAISNASVERDRVISLMAVGEYAAAGGLPGFENITRTSKWGTSNAASISSVFSTDFETLDITGRIELSSTSLTVACGDIEQSLDGVDVSQGVNLLQPVTCGANLNCASASAAISVDQLRVSSLTVSANGISLSNDVSVSLDSRPAEITLAVNATFVNGSQATVSTDPELVTSEITIDGQIDVIDKKTGTQNVFTVLAAGTAKIQINYRNQSFIAVLLLP